MTESIKRSKKAGLPPGSLVYIGKKRTDLCEIDVIDYDSNFFKKIELIKPEDTFAYKDNKRNSWINIIGLNDTSVIDLVSKKYGLDSLLIEDLLNTKHRPKVEEHKDHLFVTLKMLGIAENGEDIITEQISFVLSDNWLITYQEVRGDFFEYIRDRMQAGKGNIRDSGIDFLFYRLIDTVVDNYYHVIEHLNVAVETAEEQILRHDNSTTLANIQRYKKQMIGLRRKIIPLREVMSVLQNEDTKFVSKLTSRHFRDIYEHIIQISDLLEGQREMISGLRDLHMTEISNRMNKIMQLLTIISTIFIPLTFIAGIYGMNFEYIPELKWKYGYFIMWILMITISILMIHYFRKKKWM